MKNKWCIHICNLRNGMLMTEIFCDLNRCNLHSGSLNVMLMPAAQKDIFIKESLFILFPF